MASDVRLCTACNKSKPVECFFAVRKKSREFMRTCGPCQRARELPILELLEQSRAGTSCLWCGEQRPTCIDFDHIDPKLKARDDRGYTMNMLDLPNIEVVAQELRKCQTLCRNCHNVKTAIDKQTGALTWRRPIGPRNRPRKKGAPTAAQRMKVMKKKIVDIAKLRRGRCEKCMLKVREETMDYVFYFLRKQDSPYSASVATFAQGNQVNYPYLNMIDASELMCANCGAENLGIRYNELPMDLKTGRTLWPEEKETQWTRFDVTNAPAQLTAWLPPEMVMECEEIVAKLHMKRKFNESDACSSTTPPAAAPAYRPVQQSFAFNPQLFAGFLQPFTLPPPS